MRILISGLWAAHEPSGICRTVVNLVRGLQRTGSVERIFLVIGAWQKQYFEEKLGLKKLDVEVHTVDIPNHAVSRNAWYAFGLGPLAMRLSADIVHLSFPSPVIKRAFACPIVMCLHDLYPFDQPKNFGFPRVFVNQFFLRKALHAVDRVACVSEFTLQRLKMRFPKVAQKALCIPNAIELNIGTQGDQRSMQSPYFLAVAQHRANKNLELLLETFRRCKDLQIVRPDTKLLIVGSEGPETGRIQDRVRYLALQQDVIFLSNRDDRQMASFYANCELFITLSTIEGSGLPVGEALFFRARIVASDIPAHREVGGRHCQYVDLSVEPKVRSVMAAIVRATQGPRPQANAVANFSAEVVGQRYLGIYREAIESCGTTEAERLSPTQAVAK